MTTSGPDASAGGAVADLSEWDDQRPPPTGTASQLRLLAGVVAGVGALVLPWVGLSFAPNLGASGVHLAFASLPLAGHLTYAEVVACTLAGVVVSALRAGGRSTVTTRALGWALLATALVFVVTTRLMDSTTMLRLTADGSQNTLFGQQLLDYHTPPTSLLGFTFHPTTSLFLYGLRLGWYLLALSGLLLAGRVPRPRNRFQRVAVGAGAACSVLVAVAVALGAIALSERDQGIAAVRSGHPARAEVLLRRAERLNPQLANDPALLTALGEAELARGGSTALTSFAQANAPPSSPTQIPQQILRYEQAHDRDPNNPVILNGLIVALCQDTLGSQAPVVPSVAEQLIGSPIVAFTYGHYSVEVGDDTSAVFFLNRAIVDTPNAELRSLAYTYLALAEQQLGHEGQFRADVVTAVVLDKQNINGLGRELAAGLYVPSTS